VAVSATRIKVPTHVARVLAALQKRGLHSRPHPSDPIQIDAQCPCCGGRLELRDVDWQQRDRRVVFYCSTGHAKCGLAGAEQAIPRALGLRERDLFLGRRR
jgi:hypothetical protein